MYALAACLVLSITPLTAEAAGLGRIVVFSALGQPLRAEIEVSASREELSDMKAQLASPDTFKQAGLDYAESLLGISFSLDKRQNGKTIIKLSSERPINDPFVDMLLELNWPNGRLVREYTFLLDPPEVALKDAPPIVTVETKAQRANARLAARASSDAPVKVSEESGSEKEQLRARARKSVSATPEKSTSQSAGQGNGATRLVKQGDNLRKIALENKLDGVSLDQMLVGLVRANQNAFVDGNMNRLKAGRILTIPDQASLAALPTVEARKVIATQSADWQAYRAKLAGIAANTPTSSDGAKSTQSTGGSITPMVQENVPAAGTADQVKIAKTTKGGKGGSKSAASEGDLLAQEKAIQEANTRVTMLTKTVNDLQELIKIKDENLARLQKEAEAGAKAKEPVAPDATQPVVPEIKPPVAAEAAPVVAEEVNKPAVVEPPPPKPVQEPPKSKPAPPPLPAPLPIEEPGIIDILLDNILWIAGGIAALGVGVGGFLFMRRRQQQQAEEALDTDSTLSLGTSELTTNSVFRNTGGKSVDTSSGSSMMSSMQSDFSRAGPGSIDNDAVDPVAEADVYLAYGREAQAEEILLEAKQKDPKRYAVYLKLLEIYANRQALQQFEVLAADLYGETGGVGVDWEQAVAMGRVLIPANPLFGGAEANQSGAPLSVRNTVTLPGELSEMAEQSSANLSAPANGLTEVKPKSPPPASFEDSGLSNLDFDLGLKNPTPAVPKPSAPLTPAPKASNSGLAALDFDSAAAETMMAPAATETLMAPSGVAQRASASTDLNIPTHEDAATFVLPKEEDLDATRLNLPQSGSAHSSFSVNLTDSSLPLSGAEQASVESQHFDISSIDLDLQGSAEETKLSMPDLSFNKAQTSTSVNDDFEQSQSETLVSPSLFDNEPNLIEDQDFSTKQSETLIHPSLASDDDADYAGDQSEFDIGKNEELTTKLDLAKAYEDMGDLEGARELLQEVINEGDANYRSKAKAALDLLSKA